MGRSVCGKNQGRTGEGTGTAVCVPGALFNPCSRYDASLLFKEFKSYAVVTLSFLWRIGKCAVEPGVVSHDRFARASA